jgi:hypothetical protein
VDLPYAKQNPLRIGVRNYYAKAIEFMVTEDVVGKPGAESTTLKAESLRREAHSRRHEGNAVNLTARGNRIVPWVLFCRIASETLKRGEHKCSCLLSQKTTHFFSDKLSALFRNSMTYSGDLRCDVAATSHTSRPCICDNEHLEIRLSTCALNFSAHALSTMYPE